MRLHLLRLYVQVLQGVSEEIIRMATPVEDLDGARVSITNYDDCYGEYRDYDGDADADGNKMIMYFRSLQD